MSTITLNNLGVNEASNIVCLTDIPNILKLQDTDGGTRPALRLSIANNLSTVVSKDGEYYITVLGETVTNVTSPDASINKYFYVSSSDSTTAAYLARALRNCPSIAASFDVYNSASSVYIVAKSVGSVNWDNNFLTNISSTNLTYSGRTGSASSSLLGAKIDVDIYDGDDGYVTTLEKNYYGSECSFDLSPVLTTMAKLGRTDSYTMKVTSLKGDVYDTLAEFDTNYVAQGYMVNQGYKYINLGDSTLMVAQNFARGSEKTTANNTTLYLYGSTVPFSFYTHNNGGFNITIDYLDSDYSVLGTYSGYSWTNTDSSRKLWDYTVDLAFDTVHKQLFDSSFYIDVTLGNAVTWRYNVIKPLKATEYYQRILWRNSYGGISFFDFTGQKTIANDIDNSTYQNSIYGYYTDEINTLEKVYDVDVKTTYTLKSHLIDADGRWTFFDLMESPMVWTEVNGEKYEVIIDSVQVDETDNNDIYQATVKMHISMPITIL